MNGSLSSSAPVVHSADIQLPNSIAELVQASIKVGTLPSDALISSWHQKTIRLNALFLSIGSFH